MPVMGMGTLRAEDLGSAPSGFVHSRAELMRGLCEALHPSVQK